MAEVEDEELDVSIDSWRQPGTYIYPYRKRVARFA
jgi:hypothetical protein